MKIDQIFYLAFGSYGITVFPELNSKEMSNREDIAKALRLPIDRLPSLEMHLLQEGPTPGVAIFRQVGKVSYLSTQVKLELSEVIANAIDLTLKGGAKIRLDAGITAVLAQTQWGKTTFTSRDLVPSLASVGNVGAIDYISFLEPIEDLSFENAPVNLSWCSSHSELFKLLATFLVSDRKVCVIDSLRAFIYDNSVGGTAAGGMDAYLPIQLTALSNLVAQLGKHLIVTINPMMPAVTDEDRGKFYDLQKRIESSIPTVMTSGSQRTLGIHMRGPSAPSSKVVQYTVPNFELRGRTNSTETPKVPSGVTVIKQADSVSNVIAGIVGSL